MFRPSKAVVIGASVVILSAAFGVWVTARLRENASRAERALSTVIIRGDSAEAARASSAVRRDLVRQGASVPQDATEDEAPARALGDPDDVWSMVDPSSLGLVGTMADRFDAAYVYEGGRNDSPAADLGPRSAGSPAGTVSEAELVAKEELLLEHFPELRGKVEAGRQLRQQSQDSFQRRGGLGPEEYALQKGVHLDK